MRPVRFAALTGYAPVEQPKTMKLKIAISLLNESGSLARLENDDMDSVDFCESNTSQDAKKLCMKAAKELREYAARFEMLANEPNPFKEATQNRVNRAKVEAHSEKLCRPADSEARAQTKESNVR